MNNETKKSYQIIKIKNINIAFSYRKRKIFGPKVSIIFLSGYKSDMQGTKAIYLDKLSKSIGFEYLRFDYTGHGFSEENSINNS